MIPINEVKWGPTDALVPDKDFSQKWTETQSILNCLQQNKWIVTGEKGTGKSAIRCALKDVEAYRAKYIAVPVVDFNDIAFKALYNNLVEFAKTTNLSKTATLSHYWQYAILTELIQAAANVKDEYRNTLNSLPNYQRDIKDTHISVRLTQLLAKAWNMIDDFTYKSSSKKKKRANLLACDGLTANLLSELQNFPLDKLFIQARQKFFEQLSKDNDKIVIVLDGFDRLRNEGAPCDAIRLIFDSLIDAVLSIRAYKNLPTGLEIKAFIPHDRYLASKLRDSDKADTMHASIRWARHDLQEFLKRRLELTPKLSSNQNFSWLWSQVMPRDITNKHYNLTEESFDYILRHTMMRPRQLQIHLENLSAATMGRTVQQSDVPNAIAESSKKIAKFFIDEFQADHPNLGLFIGSLHSSDNVITYQEFHRIIEKALKRFYGKKHAPSVQSKVDTLYAMGFFGIVHFIESNVPLGGSIYSPPTHESRRHYVDFFYKNPHPSISTTLLDDSLVAFHPIFVDYAGLKPHSSLIIG